MNEPPGLTTEQAEIAAAVGILQGTAQWFLSERPHTAFTGEEVAAHLMGVATTLLDEAFETGPLKDILE